MAIYHLTQSKGGISSIELGRRLGVKQPTAWLMKHKLMRAMAGREAHKPKLAGRIEIDGTYLGGERSGGKRGRGAAGKTPVVAAVETTAKRKPRRLKLTVVKGFRKKEVAESPSATSCRAATLLATACPAGWPSSRPAARISRCGPARAGRPHGRSPFAWVNTMLGNIKTALVGTYHHVSAKHAASYLASFAYRFNRRYQLDSIVERLAWAALRTAPQPYRIISADA